MRIILGHTIIIWILFCLILLKRYPYEINEKIPTITLIIVLLFLLKNFIEIKTIINHMKRKQHSIISQIIGFVVDKMYLYPLKCVGKLLLKNIIIIRLIEKIGNILTKIIINKWYSMYYTFLILLIPRLLLGCILFFDVVFLRKIEVFYHNIYLYIIPLIFIALLWLTEEYFTNEKLKMDKFVIIKNEKPGNIAFEIRTQKDKEMISKWIEIYNILDIIKSIDIIKKIKIFCILKILIIIIFSITWFLYLFYVAEAIMLHTFDMSFFFKYIILLWLPIINIQ